MAQSQHLIEHADGGPVLAEREPAVPTASPTAPRHFPTRPGAPPLVPDRRDRDASDRLARRALRAQVAKLEGELSDAVATAFPHADVPIPTPVRGAGPRLLDLGDLERLRDRLAARVAAARAAMSTRAQAQEHNRILLERMLLEPGRYKFMRIAAADIGEGGCGVYAVRPRLGNVGMLAGWWQVKLSSGCPLAEGPRAERGPGSEGHTDLSRPGGPRVSSRPACAVCCVSVRARSCSCSSWPSAAW
jgi:hypothetical protein